MRKPLAFLLREAITFTTYRTALILQLFSMVISLASYFFLAKLVGNNLIPLLTPYGGNFLSFLLIGVIFQNFFAVSQNTFSGAVSSEQRLGTLEILLASGLKPWEFLFCSALWPYLLTLLNSSLIFGLGLLVFGMKLSPNIGLALLSFLLTIISVAGIGMISAGIILVNKQGDPISWFMGMLSGFLSGVYYPVEILPPWLQGLAQVLPQTHGLRALRLSLLQHAGWEAVGSEIMILLAFSLLTIPLGVLTFRWAFRKVRRDGTLGFY
ncbi:MAG: ABC transporter permease [Caldiserica bacterium]|jgi:ABC-2 type transport system permease protein|nr:ABC transporter permease [Caldisericota bacterium]